MKYGLRDLFDRRNIMARQQLLAIVLLHAVVLMVCGACGSKDTAATAPPSSASDAAAEAPDVKAAEAPEAPADADKAPEKITSAEIQYCNS
jgi:hypothetical protein